MHPCFFTERDTLPCISKNDFTNNEGAQQEDGRMVWDEHTTYVKKKKSKWKENVGCCWWSRLKLQKYVLPCSCSQYPLSVGRGKKRGLRVAKASHSEREAETTPMQSSEKKLFFLVGTAINRRILPFATHSYHKSGVGHRYHFVPSSVPYVRTTHTTPKRPQKNNTATTPLKGRKPQTASSSSSSSSWAHFWRTLFPRVVALLAPSSDT